VSGLKFLFHRTREVDIPVVVAAADEATRGLLNQEGFLKGVQVAASVDEAIDSGMV
jgi:hypothetical protein